LFALVACPPKTDSGSDSSDTRPGESQPETGPDSQADSGPDSGPDSDQPPPPSIVLVVTDDQRWDTLWAMPMLQQAMLDDGLQFDAGYVTTPLCCPARGSLFSGGFLPHRSGVQENSSPNGGFDSFDDSVSIGVRFHDAGYRTAMLGKYLNQYTYDAPYIPPGWDRFAVPLIGVDWYAYDAAEGGTDEEGTVLEVEQYYAEYLHDAAMEFLDEAGDEPFFLYLNYFASHDPSTPAEEDDEVYDGERWRGGAFNEGDFTDKPDFMQDVEELDEATIAEWDETYEDGLESLLAVDRSVAGIVDALEASGRIDDTVLVFTSDNGFLWGEHRLYSKGYAYQESLRVPLVVRMPGGATGLDSDHMVAITLDIPATLYDIAGIDAPTGGQSFLPILQGTEPDDWRDSVPLQAYGLGGCPAYAGIVTPEWKYVEYVSGEVELYNLEADPIEARNLYGQAAYDDTVAELSERVDDHRGVGILTDSVRLTLGEEANAELEVWGGVAPYTWEQSGGDLPDGVSVSSDGHITGTPSSTGSTMLAVQVTDSSSSPYHGGPQVYSTALRMSVSSSMSEPLQPLLRERPRVRSWPTRASVKFDLSDPVPLELTLAADPGFDFQLQALEAPGAVLQIEGLRPATRYYVQIDNLPGKPAFSFTTAVE